MGAASCHPQPPQPASANDLDSLRQAMAAAVGPASCRAKEQCRAVGVGAKPCGGPRSYLIYSTATTDSAALALIAQRYDAADARQNRVQGLVSDCTFLPPPQLECVAGRCTGAAGP